MRALPRTLRDISVTLRRKGRNAREVSSNLRLNGSYSGHLVLELFRAWEVLAGRNRREVGGKPVDDAGGGEELRELAARVVAPFRVEREQAIDRRKRGRARAGKCARQKPELKRIAGELPGVERGGGLIAAQVAAKEQEELIDRGAHAGFVARAPQHVHASVDFANRDQALPVAADGAHVVFVALARLVPRRERRRQVAAHAPSQEQHFV